MRQVYIGVKQVYLTAMTRAQYNEYRGWQLPADEEGSDEGYLVEYLDGGKPNDPRHKGYISWSPKDVADRHYKALLPMPSDALERLKQEEAALTVKIGSLMSFIHGEGTAFNGLETSARHLLIAQLGAMQAYREILGLRISLTT